MSSKKVDERVVEMRFDNSKFEANVKTSMSTLEKLKQALKLPNASKSLENVSAAAKKVDFSGMTSGIETVNARFSSMQVIGMTALSNITTAAMQAGRSLISSFTIEPITNGFREYELQMNSVQTILANTASKGTDIQDVTAALDELNEYADMTIYNFGEMTKNIGTFTAAGVDLEKSVAAIKGIANLGAMSGSTSAQVSTAMYQLSQALAAGRVSLMDWNSVVNAGMGGEQFQNALKRTAEHFGTDVDAMIAKYGSFRESLTQGGWLTAEVLTETLNQISGAYSEADLIAQGYTESQAKAIVEMANTATDAATKVKTFTQLMDTLSEAAGSGWAKTWQLLLGDFEEAKEFFTGLSDYLGGMIDASSEARNALVGDAMNSNWVKLTQQIEGAGVPLDTFTEKLKEVAKEAYNIDLDAKVEGFGSLEEAMKNIPQAGDMIVETLKRLAGAGGDMNKSTEAMTQKLEHFQKVVDEVWNGDYGNADTGRIEKLTAAGYDYAEVQALVNKTVNGQKLTLEDLNETQMKAIGFTDEQVDSLKKLSVEAEKSGTSINELIYNLNKPSGRELFLDSLFNILKAIIEPLRAVKQAFNEVFAVNGDQIYGVIEGLNRFSEAILMDEESLRKLTSTFKGVFGVIKVFTSLIGGAFGIAFNVLTTILEHFNLGILDVTAFLGEAVYAFTDFITLGDTFTAVISGIGSAFSWIVEPVQEFIASFAEIPAIKQVLEMFGSAVDNIRRYFESLGSIDPGALFGKIASDIQNAFANLSWEGVLAGLANFGSAIRNAFASAIEQAQTIGPDIIAGLQNGLSGGIDRVLSIMREIGTKILEAIKAVLGIQSPSTEMFEVGQNIIEGLINGIKSLLEGVWSVIQGIAQGIADFFGGLDWGAILLAAMSAGFLVTFYKMANALETLASPLEGLGDVFEQAAQVLDTFQGTLKAFTLNIKAQALKSIAIAIAILVGSIAVLTFLDVGKVWASIGALAVLGGILVGLSVAMSKFTVGGVIDAAKISGIMLSVGTSLLLFAATMKIVSTMSWPDLGKVAASIVGLGVVIALLAKFTSDYRTDLDQVTGFIAKLGASMLVLAVAGKLIATMSWEDLGKAGAGIGGLTVFISALVVMTKFAGESIDQVGGMILKIGAAMLLLTVVAKLISGMSWEDMDKAAYGIVGLGAIVVGLVYITKAAGEDVDKIGGTILKIAIAMGALALVAKLISGMSFGDMAKAGVGLAGLVGIIALMIKATNLGPKEEMAKVTATLLGMSVAIGILAGVAVLLGMVKTENLVKGIVAVAALSALVAGMVAVTKFAQDVKGTFIGLAIAIGVMAAALVALSFVDTGKLVASTLALSAVMGMFGVVLKMSGNMTKAMGTLIVMSAAIAILGGLLYLLSGLPVESTLGTALALSTLLLALAAACRILDGVGKVSGSAIVAMGTLTLVMGGIAAILGIMSALNVEASMGNVLALSTMLLAMSAACAILGTINNISGSALAAVLVLTGVVAALAIVLGLMTALDVAPSIETAISMGIMLLAMSAAIAILGAIGPLAQMAVPAAIAMAEVLGIIALVVAAAGAIKQIPGVDWLISEGGAFLQNLGNAIGGFIGGIAGGFLEGATGSLPEVATKLSDFITRLQPFLDGVSKIDPSVQASISSLAAAIALLTGASLLDSITSFITGGSSLSDFAEQLVPFGEAMAEYSAAVSGIDAEAVTASATAAKALGELANNLPKEGGLAQAIFGESPDLGSFGSQMVQFGTAMKAYSSAITGIDTEAITASATAGKALSELASNLPKEGGLAQAIFGENTDLGTFGSQMLLFGNALKLYSAAVAGLDVGSIQNSVAAGQAINQLAQALPKEDGWVENLFGGGQTDLSEFGEQLSNFGGALQSYSTSVSGVDFSKVSSATSSVKTIVDFIEGAKDFDTSGIENIKKIDGVGSAVKSYYDQVSGVEPSRLTSSISAIQQLKSLIDSMVGMDISGVSLFNQAISELATVNIGAIVETFSSAGAQLAQVGTNLMTMLAGGINAGTGAVTSAVLVVATAMTSAITAKGGEFLAKGTLLMTQLSLGVGVGTAVVVSAVKACLSSAAASASSSYSSFYNSGKNLAYGFAAGINSGAYAAKTAARAMANAAADAARRALNEHSPSKVFMEIGEYVPEGMAIGIDRMSKVVEDSSENMAYKAIDSTRSALSRVADAVNSDIDGSQPTIAPVLDLTNVQNGVGAIGGMLNSMAPVSLLAEVNGLSRRMNQTNQNGSLLDVVSSIDKLRRDLSEFDRTQYNINGITYDDGTAIAGAVGQLIRATRIERRI